MLSIKTFFIFVFVSTFTGLITFYLKRKEGEGLSRVVVTPREGPYHEFYNYVARSSLAVGAFESGKMPDCFEEFDLVINCSTVEHDLEVPEGKEYVCLNFLDNDAEAFRKVLKPTIEKIHKYVMRKKNVLVHCVEGKSRSVAVALAYLVSVEEIKEPEHVLVILERIRGYHHFADPEQSFLDEIFDFFGLKAIEKRC